MGYHFTVKYAVVAIGIASLSACATVDMSNISATPVASSTSAEIVSDTNVVQRAASRLYNVFTNNGFAASQSKKRMRSAARILLTGLDVQASGKNQDYISSVNSVDDINADIVLAKEHVEQASKAAEIYLAMAPINASVKDELVSLQKALVVAKKAERNFAEGLSTYKAAAPNSALNSYTQSVARLSDVTDEFGLRVRSVSMNVNAEAVG